MCGFSLYIWGGETKSKSYYFYRKNLQGDVTAILDQNGNVVAEYLYDAWGKCYITYDPTGIGEINPIRYRSYYYDTETGLYYLKSRYYDPNTGRFINADVVFDGRAGLFGYNIYSYCANNPVVYKDDKGMFITLACVLVTIGVAAVASFASSVITDVIYKDEISWRDATISAGFGALSAGLTLAFPSAAVAISAVTNATESVVLGFANNDKPVEYITDAVISAGIGAATAGWGDNVKTPDYDDTINAFKKAKKGNHPKTKKEAKKVIKETKTYIVTDLVVSTTENTIFSTLTGGVGKITNQISLYIM